MRLEGGLFERRGLHPTQSGRETVMPRQESGCGKYFEDSQALGFPEGFPEELLSAWSATAAPSDIIGRAPSGKLLGRLMIGPIFTRELVVAPRRPQHFIVRTVYVTA